MRFQPLRFRMTAAAAAASLVFAQISPVAAQPVTPDGASPGTTSPGPILPGAIPPGTTPLGTTPLGALPAVSGPNQMSFADAPERVGRLARVKGSVSFHNPGDTQWSPAGPNLPVTAGNTFWTEPAAPS
jgi:hypothetical protein